MVSHHTKAAEHDRQALGLQIHQSALRGETGTVSDLLEGFFDRVESTLGFARAAAALDLNPRDYRPTTPGMSERAWRLALAEELIARVVEQRANATGSRQSSARQADAADRLNHSEALDWLARLVAAFFTRLGALLERLRLNHLAKASRTLAAGLADPEPGPTPSAAPGGDAPPPPERTIRADDELTHHFQTLMQGVHAATGLAIHGVAPPGSGTTSAWRTLSAEVMSRRRRSEVERLTVAAVEARVQAVTADWPTHLRHRIRVYDHPGDIPEPDRPSPQSLSDFTGVSGYYLPGSDTVVLIASALDGDQEVERTLWHESLHRAAREPLDPLHPVVMHNAVYRSIMQATASRPGDIFPPEALERVVEAHSEALTQCDDPRRFEMAFAGMAMADELIDLDPAHVPPTHRPVVALVLADYARSLDASGYGALAGLAHRAEHDFVERAELTHAAQLRRFAHDAQTGSRLYARAETLAEREHSLPSWMAETATAEKPWPWEASEPLGENAWRDGKPSGISPTR